MTPRPCRGGAGVGSVFCPHTTSSILSYLFLSPSIFQLNITDPTPIPKVSPLSPLQGARGTSRAGIHMLYVGDRIY